MPLTDQQEADLLTLRAARLRVATGTQVAELEYNGERTTYTRADLPTLDRLIGQLERRAYGTVRTRL